MNERRVTLSFCNEEHLTLLSAALTSKHVDRFYFESFRISSLSEDQRWAIQTGIIVL